MRGISRGAKDTAVTVCFMGTCLSLLLPHTRPAFLVFQRAITQHIELDREKRQRARPPASNSDKKVSTVWPIHIQLVPRMGSVFQAGDQSRLKHARSRGLHGLCHDMASGFSLGGKFKKRNQIKMNSGTTEKRRYEIAQSRALDSREVVMVVWQESGWTRPERQMLAHRRRRRRGDAQHTWLEAHRPIVSWTMVATLDGFDGIVDEEWIRTDAQQVADWGWVVRATPPADPDWLYPMLCSALFVLLWCLWCLLASCFGRGTHLQCLHAAAMRHSQHLAPAPFLAAQVSHWSVDMSTLVPETQPGLFNAHVNFRLSPVVRDPPELPISFPSHYHHHRHHHHHHLHHHHHHRRSRSRLLQISRDPPTHSFRSRRRSIESSRPASFRPSVPDRALCTGACPTLADRVPRRPVALPPPHGNRHSATGDPQPCTHRKIKLAEQATSLRQRSAIVSSAAPPEKNIIMTRSPSTTPEEQDDSRSSSSTASPAPPDNEESDFFLGANDSESSLGVPNIQDMQVDDSCWPPISRLPNEILISIFAKLGATPDLYHCMLVSKRWARNAVDLLWHRPACTSWSKHQSICQTLGREHPFFSYRDFIKRLNLAALADKVNDGSVMPLATCTRVERLTLTNCSGLTDSGLIALVNSSPSLLALDISNDKHITEKSIVAIAENCKRLQGLNISGCDDISNESMIHLAQNCKYIKRVRALYSVLRRLFLIRQGLESSRSQHEHFGLT